MAAFVSTETLLSRRLKRVLKGKMGTGICSFSVLGIGIFMSFITGNGIFMSFISGNGIFMSFISGNWDFHVFHRWECDDFKRHWEWETMGEWDFNFAFKIGH